jgi:hypothetical protein
MYRGRLPEDKASLCTRDPFSEDKASLFTGGPFSEDNAALAYPDHASGAGLECVVLYLLSADVMMAR